nr:PREDICTED: uncharacterized protein LOC105677741 [Linepithema humile]
MNVDTDQFFQDSHYNINRILLSISGLWPFHTKVRRYMIYFVLILVIGSGFFFQIKILLIKIQEYSLSAKSNEEHKIQNSHALFGRNFGYIYTYVILGHNLLYTTATLLTRFMHTQVEKNDTSSDEIISAQIGISYRVNYFVDFDTYYVPIFIHTSLCTLCYIILIVTFDVLYITFVEHCRGLFATVR